MDLAGSGNLVAVGQSLYSQTMSTPSRLFRIPDPRRLAVRLALGVSRISRGMTLGVRAVLLKDDQVVLVRHSYLPGWHFPGGGVEAGESFHQAMVREAREEAAIELTGPADLFGVYRNGPANPRDHVALYVCRNWEQPVPPKPNLEIRACELFTLDGLPEDITAGTNARLLEIRDGVDPATDW